MIISDLDPHIMAQEVIGRIPYEASSVRIIGQVNDQTSVRFVAFLDIMGFKERVARNKHQDILASLETFQSNISCYIATHQDADIQMAMFSDSILLYSKDITSNSLSALADITSHVMMYALQQDIPIPLKGAIAAGEMTCNQTKQLYFGQALIDAYLLEESVKYYGVVLHHSAEKYVVEYGASKYFQDKQVPLKSGRIAHYELNWYDTLAMLEEGNAQVPLEDCLKHIRLTVSDAPRVYVDNTLDVIKNL